MRVTFFKVFLVLIVIFMLVHPLTYAVDQSKMFSGAVHWTRRSIEPPPGKSRTTVQQEQDRMKALDMKMYREDFDWGTIEPQNNQFNFSTYDVTVNDAISRGLEPLAILDYTTSWTGALDSERYRDDFADYAYNTVLHFKDRVHYWEVWNEETGRWFWPNPDPVAYGKLLIKAAKAIKRADPTATVIFGGTHALQGLLDANSSSYVSRALAVQYDGSLAFNVVDIIAGHAYIDRFAGETPEDLFDLNVSQYYEKYDQYLRQTYGSGKRYWHTETGWSTATAGNYRVSFEDQANFIVRMYLIFLGGNTVETYFQYDLRDDGTNNADYEQNLGLLEHDFTPKPSYNAYKNMVSLLKNARIANKLPWTDGAYGYIFTDPTTSRTIYALWTKGADISKTISIGATSATKVSLFGITEQLNLPNQSLTITLTKQPIYLLIGGTSIPTATLTPTPPLLQTGYLSDQSWTSMINGDGLVLKDRANNGQVGGGIITLNGVTFSKGLGAHANSDIKYNLSGQCSTFAAKVGVDDSGGADNGSVIFQVFGDTQKLFDSGTMTGNSQTQNVNVLLTGKQTLQLIVNNAGDNWNFDRADWADAFITCGSSPSPTASSSPTSSQLPGNIVPPHNIVDIFDYNAVVSDFGQQGTNLRSDIAPPLNSVDIFDYNKVVSNFGRTQ